MKVFKRLIALAMVALLCLTVLASCVRGQGADPETRPLTMGIQKPDEVFNPFFSTSAMDSEVIGMTQISMLTSSADGSPKCGDDEPVVVKAYKETKVTVGGQDYTDYSFIIKNGIKFSDGKPLTIKDVLFNLYVYLDPVYTGSATIYSTDIVGLQAYRQQDPDATEAGASAFEDRFITKANMRITELVTFVQAFGNYNPSQGSGLTKPSKDVYTDEEIKSYRADVVYIAKEFRRELESDWNAASVESYKDEGFTAKWQVFLVEDAQATDLYKMKEDQSGFYKDEKGNMQLDKEIAAGYQSQLDEFLASQEIDMNNAEAVENGTREWAINAAYMQYFPDAIVDDVYTEDALNDDNIAATISTVRADQFELILYAWMTGTNAQTKFIADAKEAELGSADHPVKTVSGITTSTTTKDFNGKDLGATHDVLNIRINGVDPKAIWNFSFTVAPLHYYSGTYEGVNYVDTFDAEEGNFGFKFSSSEFFNSVLNGVDKTGLPLGAGVYMASTKSGGVATTKKEFFDGSIACYERNPYFETLGSGISNAKIKYFRYKVVESDQIINSLITKEIDIGEPNATPENSSYLDSKKFTHEETMTSGYGYVGINPRFIPDVTIRRAIIKAMNTQMIKDNYYKSMCEIIYRPMSKANWAYPKTATVYTTTYEDTSGNVLPVSYAYDKTGEEIEELVKSAGYIKGSDGIYHKRLADGTDHKLSYEFTIAGSSVDHPAYSMFVNAAAILNNRGFDIKVKTRQSALSDLSAGKLTVWAAAWSSTIDPDMYQVYHKDSNATSVNNWGYPQIKAKPVLYPNESVWLQELSDLIDDGRATTDQDSRKQIYAQALDKVMEFAVEFPTYQRNDMIAFDKTLLDRKTMTPKKELGPYNGLLNRIWELNYAK